MLRRVTHLLSVLAIVSGCSSSSSSHLVALDDTGAGGSGVSTGQGGASSAGGATSTGAGGGTTFVNACAGHTESILVIAGAVNASSVGKTATWSTSNEGWAAGFGVQFSGNSSGELRLTARPTNGLVLSPGDFATDTPDKADAMHLGLDVGCGVAGNVSIAGIAWDGDRLNEVSATFNGHCQGGGPVSGCLHYVREGYTLGTPPLPAGYPPKAGVGMVEPCMVGGNVAYLFGDDADYIHAGPDVVTGDWAPSLTMGDDFLDLHVTPNGTQHGGWWTMSFSTEKLGHPLSVGVYENADRAAFASASHAGLDIGGDGRGCNELTGKFQIHDVAFASPGKLSSFTASFEQYCELGSAALRGCVHYSAP